MTASPLRDDRDRHRLVIEAGDGLLTELVYDLDGDRLSLLHTEVPPEFRGHGVGGRLVSAAVAWAAEERLTIVPWCPYARRWLRERPDVAASVTIDWATRHAAS